MIRPAIFALALLVSPAAAQVVTAPPSAGSVVDAAARAAAAEAKATAEAAQAAIPVPATTIPTMETIGGAAGSTNTFRRGDAVQPRISRTVSGATTAGGSGTVTWPAMQSVPKLTVTPYVAAGATQAPVCVPVSGTVTTTGATIKCWTTQTVTVSLLGAVVAPLTTAAAGVQFDVLALPGS